MNAYDVKIIDNYNKQLVSTSKKNISYQISQTESVTVTINEIKVFSCNSIFSSTQESLLNYEKRKVYHQNTLNMHCLLHNSNILIFLAKQLHHVYIILILCRHHEKQWQLYTQCMPQMSSSQQEHPRMQDERNEVIFNYVHYCNTLQGHAVHRKKFIKLVPCTSMCCHPLVFVVSAMSVVYSPSRTRHWIILLIFRISILAREEWGEVIPIYFRE